MDQRFNKQILMYILLKVVQCAHEVLRVTILTVFVHNPSSV